MPLGSSSAAPVTSPGPSLRKNPGDVAGTGSRGLVWTPTPDALHSRHFGTIQAYRASAGAHIAGSPAGTDPPQWVESRRAAKGGWWTLALMDEVPTSPLSSQ